MTVNSSAGSFPEPVRAASELLSALASPMRLTIVALLDEHGTRCVHELVTALGAAQPLVSQHLRVLRSAGLVAGERHHREVHYRLVDGHVGHIVRDALDHAVHMTDEGHLADDGDGTGVAEEELA
ncbi:metalloregulator ArsR/SmtB family transcription factor [Modestobacter sp. NPDC049651]|uniref:ArsR/SmtB family transcription factor n=1 Tax=unclassified Modestobacter TaxID=2643866 RepID=UPI0033F48337